MANITIIFGFLLALLGPIGYFGAREGSTSLTPFIPSAVGILLMAFGFLARSDKLRMIAMHVAVLIGLLGFLAGLVRSIMVAIKGIELPLAFGLTVAMTVLCGVFVAMCVRSFIQARRSRAANGR